MFFHSKSLSCIEMFSFFRLSGRRRFRSQIRRGRRRLHDFVQERDIYITFVTHFSCWRVWKREILMKIGSRWTQKWKNESSPKIMISFFIFCLYINEKWKNHDFWGCHSSFLMKNHWKIMIFGFLWLRKNAKIVPEMRTNDFSKM